MLPVSNLRQRDLDWRSANTIIVRLACPPACPVYRAAAVWKDSCALPLAYGRMTQPMTSSRPSHLATASGNLRRMQDLRLAGTCVASSVRLRTVYESHYHSRDVFQSSQHCVSFTTPGPTCDRCLCLPELPEKVSALPWNR